MTADHLLLTAVAMHRQGSPPDEIEAAIVELARRDEVGCHCQRNFGGHVEVLFSDGQCLRFDGRSWALTQQHVAPLYAATLSAFDSGTGHGGPAWGA